MLTTNSQRLKNLHPYYGLAATSREDATKCKLSMAPHTIPSNHCLLVILSFTCGRSEAIARCEYNRLCRRALHYFSKANTLKFFNMAPLRVTLNHWTDPQRFLRERIHILSRNHALKVKLCVPLSSVATAVRQSYDLEANGQSITPSALDTMNRNESRSDEDDDSSE